MKVVGVAGAIGAFMVRAHHFRDLWPGELNGGNNAMTLHGMVSHLLEFPGLQRAGLAKKMLIHSYQADVVQVSGGAHLAGLGGAHARSEEHTSELQSRFGISYAVFCLKKN